MTAGHGGATSQGDDETAQTRALFEGGRTLGVWLPIALANIACIGIAQIRMQAAHPERVKVPKVHEILADWALPCLAEALKADSDEREAFEFVESVRRLGGNVSGGRGE